MHSLDINLRGKACVDRPADDLSCATDAVLAFPPKKIICFYDIIIIIITDHQ